jgi:hypothetical protein
MEYFSSFPSVTESINGNNVTRIDISYATLDDSEDYQAFSYNTNGKKEIGSVSLGVYKDANNFWALMFANDATNPWTLIPVDPYQNSLDNSQYSGLYGKYNGATKLDPNAYVTFKDGDILVIGSYAPGATAAKDVFAYYDNAGFYMYFVQKAFSDTKKAKVTPNINLNTSEVMIDIADPDVVSNTVGYITLRKGNDGYALLPSLGGASGGSSYITNLKAYSYEDSPAYFTPKETNDLISPETAIEGTSDSILTVISNDSAGATAVQEYSQTYKQISTKEVYKINYQNSSYLKYITQGNFSTILGKLV